MRDTTVRFLHYFLPSLCEISDSQSIQISELSEMTSYGAKENGAALLFSRLNHCWPLYRVLMPGNSDTVTRLGQNFRLFKALMAVGSLEM